ncbi:hypothetical protein GCM10011581_19220 [Saccharopolyspora subtropica]|uniref:Uncharacterized protein n=1 Tax=Saccharopolyspora thermophila TaxID=89367 RepID=A0A917NAK5_9PSEU|nr:hypothetical protein [Saccharopolyspora subtropica]GGI81904.1 hypothetical protein GCM10011581_19220 [Saccharopolyspora subtropica]
MDLEEELRRIFREDRLDIPVRTGAEWSLVAGARRRRQRAGMMAAAGSALAAMLLVGGGVALVSHQPDQPVRPAVPTVLDPLPKPSSTTTRHPSEPPAVPLPPGQIPPAPAITVPPPSHTPSPTILRTETTRPEPTSTKPSETSAPNQSSSQHPTSEANPATP